jgi:hypothetical protein
VVVRGRGIRYAGWERRPMKQTEVLYEQSRDNELHDL